MANRAEALTNDLKNDGKREDTYTADTIQKDVGRMFRKMRIDSAQSALTEMCRASQINQRDAEIPRNVGLPDYLALAAPGTAGYVSGTVLIVVTDEEMATFQSRIKNKCCKSQRVGRVLCDASYASVTYMDGTFYAKSIQSPSGMAVVISHAQQKQIDTRASYDCRAGQLIT
jgi:hypothetical protein